MSDTNKRMTWWEALRRFPPCAIRVYAKRNRATPLSDTDIAIASGIDLNRVREIKLFVHWQDVTIGEAMRYMMACNFDPTDAACRNRAKSYDRVCLQRCTTPFKFQQKSPKWESELIPAIRAWASTLRSAA